MQTIKGPGILLSQFAGNKETFNRIMFNSHKISKSAIDEGKAMAEEVMKIATKTDI